MKEPRPVPEPLPENEQVRRSRRARAALDPEQAPINYVWRHYRKRCNTLDEAIDFLAGHGLTDRDVMLTAQLLWGVVEELGLWGDVKAATYGVDRALGTPDRPFADRVQDMSLNEIIAEFKNGWEQLGVPEALIESTLLRGSEKVKDE